MFVEALQNILASDAGMQSFLGTPAQRPDSTNGCFPVQAIDQPTMPYVVYSQVSGDPMEIAMQGTGRLRKERWRISFCGSTYAKAKKFAKYGQAFLASVIGPQPAPGNCDIRAVWIKMEADDSEN